MGWIDWLIVIIPTVFVMYMGLKSRQYICQVSDFLSAGRLCGRYVLSVGDIANALSIIGLVAYVEVHYKTGFALSFWQNLSLPLGIFLSLTGFCAYRFRETKAMSFGQYLEMRYSRKLRIFGAFLRSMSEMLCNMIMPAIAARFFIYYLGLPHHINIGSLAIPTFLIIIVICLVLAVSLICMGGTLTLVITDAIQGMICYPLMALFVFFVLYKFSWNGEIVPVMCDRIKGESFLDPYDMYELRDFNIFFVMVALINSVFTRCTWLGGGASTSARSPHEQKMAGLLGTWRAALNTIFYIVIAVALLTFFNHKKYADVSRQAREKITNRVSNELIKDEVVRNAVIREIAALPVEYHTIGKDQPLSEKHNVDTPYLESAKKAILSTCKDEAAGHKQFQQFRTLYHQMMAAIGIRTILPDGMVGLFCLLMVLAMISTDDSRMFSAALTLTQDVVVPLCKRTLTPEEHIRVIKIVAIGVGVFFFIGSMMMSQLDYINLFMSTMTSLWAGAGAMATLGLYTRFGTTAGAWASLLSGMFISGGYIFLKQYWTSLYQFLDDHGWADNVGRVLEACSAPFEPIIVWRMNPTKCPINAYEVTLIVLIVTLLTYIIVSKLTCKTPFNLDRMLHRGKYNLDKDDKTVSKWTWKTLAGKLIGITPDYTTGDRVIAWALFIYSIIYRFGITFIAVLIWNVIDPWPIEWWNYYFLIVFMVVPGIIAVIVTFWFGIGGVIDMRQLFRDLKQRVVNTLDNGMVEGNMSLADKKELEKLDE